ncbi:MAG: metallophosphoesterase [Magnetococcales bacterium]|nr:metallophosphoesterase [Magnetococcales bacterium]
MRPIHGQTSIVSVGPFRPAGDAKADVGNHSRGGRGKNNTPSLPHHHKQTAVKNLVAIISMIYCVFCWDGRDAAAAGERRLTLLHVNDVYQLTPVDGLGGMAYLSTLIKQYRHKDNQTVLTLGGDLLSPSLLSSLVHGRQMVAAFNALGLDLAVPGNHEFDFGPKNLGERISQSQAQWLAANLVSKDNQPFPGMKKHLLRDIHGTKVGFFGLITPETAITSDPGENWTFLPIVETATIQTDDITSSTLRSVLPHVISVDSHRCLFKQAASAPDIRPMANPIVSVILAAKKMS